MMLVLLQFILKPGVSAEPQESVSTLEPLTDALRQQRYTHIQDLHVWDLPLNHCELASLVSTISKANQKIKRKLNSICTPFGHCALFQASLLEKEVYRVRKLELMDCLIQPHPLRRLSL